MPGWRESYEQLPEEQQARVQRWLHLNKFIAHTLHLSFDDWINRFVAPAMEKPLDYGFLEALFGDFSGLGLEGQGVTFSRDVDPASRVVSRVPLRARNNLGRFSPELQDALGAMLAGGEPQRIKLTPADAAILQKLLPSEKRLARLPKPAFRKLELAREEDEVSLTVEGAAEPVFTLGVLELGAVLSRPLV